MMIERRARRTHPIPMTALIDILFQLLIFFMLSTSFIRQESIELALPSKAAPAPVAHPPAVWKLAVEASGEMRLNSDLLGSNAVNKRLRDQFAEAPDTAVLIVSGEGVNLQQLVSVMDMIYTAGGKSVAVTDQQNKPIPMQPGFPSAIHGGGR